MPDDAYYEQPETELLVNLGNKQRAELPLSDHARTVRMTDVHAAIAEMRRMREERRARAIDRLKVWARDDERVADLLTVLGVDD